MPYVHHSTHTAGENDLRTGAPSQVQDKVASVFDGNDAILFDRTIDARFTIVPNELMDSRSPYHVDHAAAGCWAHMMALGRDWRFSVKGFATVCDEGLSGIQTQLKKLERKGWVLCFRRRERGRWAPGTLWQVLDDPRRARDTVARFEALGLELYSKLDDEFAKPQVTTTLGKSESGSDLGIVENFDPVMPQEAQSATKEAQNPRSQPYSGKPYLENPHQYNILNKRKRTPISEAAQRSGSTPDERACADGAQGDPCSEALEPRPPSRDAPEPEPATAQPADGRGADAPLDGAASRPLVDDQEIQRSREAFDLICAESPVGIRESSVPKAKRAFAALTAAGREPERIAGSWRAYVSEYREAHGTDLSQHRSVLSFLADAEAVDRFSMPKAAEMQSMPASTPPSLPSDVPSERPESPQGVDKGFEAVQAAYPRPSRGAAADKALEAYRRLLSSGLSAERVLAGARAYAASVAEEGREQRYVMSLLTFLAEDKGARRWAQAAGAEVARKAAEGHEGRRKRVKQAIDELGCGPHAELVLEFAEQSGDASLLRLAEAVRADDSDPRLHARDSYGALYRAVAGRSRNFDWNEWAYRRLFGAAVRAEPDDVGDVEW